MRTASGWVEIAVWSNMVGEGNQQREVLGTTIRKKYKSGEAWVESKSLMVDDLPTVSLLLAEAHTFCSNELNRQ